MSSVKTIKNSRHTSWVTRLPFKELPRIKEVAFVKDEVLFVLDDQRIIYIPLAWSTKLKKAKPVKRMQFKNNGVHVIWPELDEIIGVKNILFGKELFL